MRSVKLFNISSPLGTFNYYAIKLIQGFRVTCLFTGQYNTEGYGTITHVI